MDTPLAARDKFPRYLKQQSRDTTALRWMGNKLKEHRHDKSLHDIANRSCTESAILEKIEDGNFSVNVGKLRKIISDGYGMDFDDLVADCYKHNKATLDKAQRHFNRPHYYSVRHQKYKDKPPTPFLIGGDTESLLWAIPLRKLEGQPLVMEFLELAPHRKRKETIGAITQEFHNGVELIFVVHGRIDVQIRLKDGDGEYESHLKAGDCIHFHSREPHSIQNADNNSSALLYIVRIPTVQK
jgi:hypothetical protein